MKKKYFLFCSAKIHLEHLCQMLEYCIILKLLLSYTLKKLVNPILWVPWKKICINTVKFYKSFESFKKFYLGILKCIITTIPQAPT